jgi:hypothetical protein
MSRMKRCLAALLLISLCLSCAMAEETETVDLDEPAEASVPTAADGFPPLNAEGFLDEGEFVFAD